MDSTVTERAVRGNPIHERVGVEVARTRALAGRQLPVDAGRVRIADAAAVLNVAGAAGDGEREPVLQREDAANLPAAEQRFLYAAAVHVGAVAAERQVPEPRP